MAARYGFALAFLRFTLRALFRVEVRGTLAPRDRMLIVANHESFIDGALLAAFLPVRPTFLVHTTIAEKWYFRLMLRCVRHAVADTRKPIAIKTLLALVQSGEPVVIFPEGRITITGALMKVYDGPAFVAAKSECAVIPVHLDGTLFSVFNRMGPGFPRKLFPKVRMTIGSPVFLPRDEASTARERRTMASNRLRRVMQEAAYQARERKTIFEWLLAAARNYGWRRPVLEDINTNFAPVSYRVIVQRSLAIGRLVRRLSAERDVIGVMMPNASATVYVLFGLIASGRAPAMLNFTAGLHGVQNAIRAAGIRLVLTSRAFVEKAKLEALVGGLEGVRVAYLEDLRAQFGAGDKLAIAIRMLRPASAAARMRPEDPALIMFTSGSEGAPKGVVLSHDNILANAAQVSAVYPFSCRDRFLSALPLFHAFGVTAGLIVPLSKGCEVVLYPSPLHYRTIPEFVYDHDCTVLFTTNTFLAKYAKAAHPYDFYNVRNLVVGAEKLGDDVERLCVEKFGLRPLEGYGATECAPVISVNTPLANRHGTAGELLPGVEARLAPVDGVPGAGVLHVRGDNVMLGYLKLDRPGELQPAASEFGQGWYNTGDVVTLDGLYLTIHARLKRFAKIAGEMVSLELVERIAAETGPGVHAASSVKAGARGEEIVLFTENRQFDRATLVAAARRMGATELAAPKRIVMLDRIPRLGSGKPDYVRLADMARSMFEQPEVRA
jgi:acyl-[acyl-carrier-protein]-phospholipid O-acyltransferase/long-chain-fatty-acid--[acyl-carrier-protein] ligase